MERGKERPNKPTHSIQKSFMPYVKFQKGDDRLYEGKVKKDKIISRNPRTFKLLGMKISISIHSIKIALERR